MTKDNILFSIIGVLLGVILGYAFATNLNRQESARRAPAVRDGMQDSEIPENHPPIPENAESVPAKDPNAEAAVIEQAQNEPDNFDAQMSAAAIHYQNRRFDEAIQLLMRANQLRPGSYETIVALGNANFDTNRFEIAEKWYTAALVKNPKDINVRTDLGLTFFFRERQDIDRAIQEFRRSLEINPRHELTLQNMVVALTKKGNLKEAETKLKLLQEVNPGNQSLAKLSSDLEAASTTSTQPASKGK